MPRLARDGELVHQPAHPGQPEAESSVRAEAVVEGTVDVGDARSAVTGHDLDPTAWDLEQLDDDLARAGETHDVAAHLGHGRGDDRQVGGREVQTGRELTRGPPRRDDVGIRRDGYAEAVVPLLPAFEERLAQPSAQVALEQVLGRVHLTLPSLVTPAEGDEHRAALVGRQLRLLCCEHVLDTQAGAGAVQLSSHRTSGASRAGSEGVGVGAADLVLEQGLTFALAQPGQSRGHGRLLLVEDDLRVREVRGAEVDDPVLVAPPAVSVAPHGGHDVAGRHDGVGLEHARLDGRRGGKDAGQGLLDEVLRGRVRADAGVNDATDHGKQVRHVLGAVTGGTPGALGRAHGVNVPKRPRSPAPCSDPLPRLVAAAPWSRPGGGPEGTGAGVGPTTSWVVWRRAEPAWQHRVGRSRWTCLTRRGPPTRSHDNVLSRTRRRT